MPPPPAVKETEAPTTPIEGDRAKQHAAEPIAGRRVIKVLYLFAGTSRKGSFGSLMAQRARRADFELILDEIDVLRGGKKHNVLRPATRQRILSDVTGGKYDAVLASPPVQHVLSCTARRRTRSNASALSPLPSRSAMAHGSGPQNGFGSQPFGGFHGRDPRSPDENAGACRPPGTS